MWNELEEEFAAFAGSEAALYFGSGYAANIGLLTSLASKNDVIFSDALKSRQHHRWDSLVGRAKNNLSPSRFKCVGIVAERKSVDSQDAN